MTRGPRSTPPESDAGRIRATSRVPRCAIDDPAGTVAELGARTLAQPGPQATFYFRRCGARVLSAEILAHDIHAGFEECQRRLERSRCRRAIWRHRATLRISGYFGNTGSIPVERSNPCWCDSSRVLPEVHIGALRVIQLDGRIRQ